MKKTKVLGILGIVLAAASVAIAALKIILKRKKNEND